MNKAKKTNLKPRAYKSSGVIILPCIIVLLCSAVSLSAQNLIDTAKIVPPDSVLLVNIDDFSRLRQQFEKTDFYKLYKDPTMAPFINKLKTKLQDKIQELDNELADIIFNKEVLPQGRVALALILNEQTKDSNDPPILFITQWGQAKDRIKELIDKLVSEAVLQDDFHRKTENYRGVDIINIGPKPSESVSYCFIDDCLIGAANPDFVKFAIAHIKGAQSPSLADDSDYTTTMKTIESSAEAKIDVYINLKQIIKTVISEDSSGRKKTTMSNIGFDNIASFGYSIGLDNSRQPDGKVYTGKALLKVNGSKQGICKMLEMESAPFRVPRFVPSSAYSLSFINLNIGKAFEALSNILNSFSPQFAAVMYMPLLPPGPQGEPSVQLKTDIINHMGSQIIISQSINDSMPNEDKKKQENVLFALATNNRTALEKSLSQLHGKILAAGNPDASRQLLGHTIYLIDIRNFLPVIMPGSKRPMQNTIEQPMPEIPKFAFTVTDTYLLFSNESTVEQAIRRLSNSDTVSIDSARWLNRAKATIPSIVGMASLEDNAVSVELLWSELNKLQEQIQKSRSKKIASEMNVGPGANSPFSGFMFSDSFSELFDLSLLPEYDKVRKYFGLSAAYGISRPDGFFFEFKYLNPNTEN